ncbi:MAG: ASKHA domain-containing protein [Synergistota bacterium]|nr:ASKHA domain-containing protein [Synergistota bacterium]
MKNGHLLFVDQNTETELTPLRDETIGKLLVRNGIYIDQPCGGTGLCGKCRVILSGSLPEPTPKEKNIFSQQELASGLRLACQSKASAGMSVSIPVQDSQNIKVLDYFDDVQASKISCNSKGVNGIAVDIGTTTLVAYLVDMATGKTLAASSAINPQTSFGADVISRISYIDSRPERLSDLQKAVVRQINDLIKELFSKTGRSATNKDLIVAAGNTTMEHIFAGISPESIGKSPFEPQFYDSIEFDAVKLGIEAENGVKVKLMPNIHGFVGGDIVSGIIYSGMHDTDELSLLVDIGTNNEMVLGNKDLMYCCSAAAGPALEGAKIKMGMRAAPGAIDSVKINGSGITITTIGDMPPVGICGSGLVDAISELLKSGVITQSGRFADKEKLEEYLSSRFKGKKGKDFSFILAAEGEYRSNPEVGITQKDIREIQLAKGAIAAGAQILLDVAGKKLDQIKNVYLAGAFGNYIDIENAVRISILPDVARERIHPVGNSAGAGACLMLKDPSLWDTAAHIIKRAEHIELANHKDFQEIFVASMTF